MEVPRMAERRDDEFYVGYAPRAPSGIARHTRVAVLLVLSVASILAMLLVSNQARFSRALHEFGVVRSFEGVIQTYPQPSLLVHRPGATPDRPGFSQYPLLGFGKLGAETELAPFDGEAVRVDGTLIYRDGQTAIELVAGSIEPLDEATRRGFAALLPPAEEDLGSMTLRGEIVDAKCFYGVMKPGHGKPHRACAVRCISGGLPPVFVVRDAGDRLSYLLLVGADGRTINQEILDVVAEPLEITGQVVRHGDLLVLRADPEGYRRL
jgi:hypothetical protein